MSASCAVTVTVFLLSDKRGSRARSDCFRRSRGRSKTMILPPRSATSPKP